MSTNSDIDFEQLMAGEGVQPVRKGQDRADLHKAAAKRDQQAMKARRQAALAGEEDGLTLKEVPLLDPYDPVEWKRDGVQDGVYRNLRLGKYQVDARLDLHRKTVVETKLELVDFLRECQQHGIRTVLVSHGRGAHQKAHGNVLKSYLNQWLPHIDEVQAFHSAQRQHGGLGAIYVLIRKGDAQRQANWEQHQKR
ncbi:DNA endonuclease SmrA [Marinobacterium arenosum]|uniref:DNA endonuclease SmrA n=1 Tax=Marinobacterium arenosum TaxID=2862496 RepID=UPI001C9845C6|nr:DNA endonuclease SmrA [Marinobacterium arenosum]MBY4675827.1 DNA endonuclease SmrA [Marinobacterium arenosum]